MSELDDAGHSVTRPQCHKQAVVSQQAVVSDLDITVFGFVSQCLMGSRVAKSRSILGSCFPLSLNILELTKSNGG